MRSRAALSRSILRRWPTSSWRARTPPLTGSTGAWCRRGRQSPSSQAWYDRCGSAARRCSAVSRSATASGHTTRRSRRPWRSGCRGSSPLKVAATEAYWHFVVGAYDRSYVRLYVDGNQIGSGAPLTGPMDIASTATNTRGSITIRRAGPRISRDRSTSPRLEDGVDVAAGRRHVQSADRSARIDQPVAVVSRTSSRRDWATQSRGLSRLASRPTSSSLRVEALGMRPAPSMSDAHAAATRRCGAG